MLLAEAIPILEAAETDYREDYAYALVVRASGALAARRWADAERDYRRALDLQRRIYGPDHLELANTYCSLAAALDELGRRDEAEPLRRQADRIRELRLGHSDQTGHTNRALLLPSACGDE